MNWSRLSKWCIINVSSQQKKGKQLGQCPEVQVDFGYSELPVTSLHLIERDIYTNIEQVSFMIKAFKTSVNVTILYHEKEWVAFTSYKYHWLSQRI